MQKLLLLYENQPWLALTTTFIAWKLLLLAIAFTAPGPGYDTCSSLLDSQDQLRYLETSHTLSNILKLVRWDAIYFTALAHRGHYFEQEWAFGKGISTLVSLIAGRESTFLGKVYAAVALSHVSHYISVLVLFELTKLACSGPKARKEDVTKLACVAASLHIISPGGLFLSAPNAESTFSMFNMCGFWLYAMAYQRRSLPDMAAYISFTVAAGISFGIACIMRGNGLLSGIPFLLDAIIFSWQLVRNADMTHLREVLPRLAATVFAGLCVAGGLLLPQVLAYQEYCTNRTVRTPWCENTLPLIFSYVQSHYWNNGFLRYWTVSNIPLFLLAAPCIRILSRSGTDAVLEQMSQNDNGLMLRLALPQLALTVLGFFTMHVQIITRLASGYPLWYIWLAQQMRLGESASYWVHFMVIYGMVQGGLFASFLPPA